MYSAEVRFTCAKEPSDQGIDAILALLGAMYKNGQIMDGGPPLTASGNEVRAYLSIPTQDALDDAHMNVYARRDIEALAAHGFEPPAFTVLGPDPSGDPECTCTDRPWVVLFTTFLSREPPLRCRACFGYVPLFSQPHTQDHEYLDLLHWEADYKACDTLQMHCTTGERFGETQLAEVGSSLSVNGREVAMSLERATGVPVYYYLHKSRGRTAESEQLRTCPGCGGAWVLETPLFHLFDFKCDACRLLSNIASGLR